jgi:chaperonin GroES
MGVRPLNDKVLIKRVDAPETTKGGIIIPDTATEKPQEGKVVAVGKGKVLENGTVKPLDVKKGDKVLFGKYGGTEINFKGDDYIIVDENDILAIIEG